MRVHAFRLTPGTDLKAALERFVHDHAILAGYILSCAGSLSHARLRMAGAIGDPVAFRTFAEPMEIVSLTGTLGLDGPHLHAALAGPDGLCVGGHLVHGCIVNTTAEVVIGEASGLEFRRLHDPVTGYPELCVLSPDGDHPSG